MTLDKEILLRELKFRTSRSSGPGGQAVNKLETRVIAILNLEECTCLDEEAKAMLFDRLTNRINVSGELAVAVSESRSQKRNKDVAIERLVELIQNSLVVDKPRKRTKPSKAAIKRRIKAKSRRSELKKNRRWKPD